MSQAKSTTTPAAKPQRVPAWRLVPNAKVPPYRGARAAWWQAVSAALAKGPVAANTLYKAHQAAPPSTPKRGRLAGQCEPPAGWYGFFSRQGLVQATTVQVKPGA